MFTSPSKTLEIHFPLNSIDKCVGKCEVNDSCVSQSPHFEDMYLLFLG